MSAAVDRKLSVTDLSSDQCEVYNSILDWKNAPPYDHRVLKVGGYAGTGKSTILGVLATVLQGGGLVAYATYTGRAASVLTRKLAACGVRTTSLSCTNNEKALSGNFGHLFYGSSDPQARMPYCGTLHRLLYRPIIDAREQIIGWKKRDELDRPYSLIVVDEASMVSSAILADLQMHRRPILAVGDHGQLPPVMDSGDLMKNPDLKLEKIHRQAEGNPIIALSREIRETGKIPRSMEGIEQVHRTALEDVMAEAYGAANHVLDTVALCWTNRMRCKLNRAARKVTGRNGPPSVGEPVICLKNNPPIYNGMRGVVAHAVERRNQAPWLLGSIVDFPEEGFAGEKVEFCEPQFLREKTFADVEEFIGLGMEVDRMSEGGDLYDFAYACTVHKFQGSACPHVLFYVDMPGSHEDFARLAYTAVTRASERLTILR